MVLERDEVQTRCLRELGERDDVVRASVGGRDEGAEEQVVAVVGVTHNPTARFNLPEPRGGGGGATGQVVAFRDARRAPRHRVELGGPSPVADPLEQVATHGEVAVPLPDERLQGLSSARRRRPAWASAATSSACDRVVRQPDQLVVPLEDLRPVGLLGRGRVVVQSGDGGLGWYSPRRSSARACCRIRTPSAISSVSHRERSWASSVTRRPSSLKLERADERGAGASGPADREPPGPRVPSPSCRVRRIASAARSTDRWPA